MTAGGGGMMGLDAPHANGTPGASAFGGGGIAGTPDHVASHPRGRDEAPLDDDGGGGGEDVVGGIGADVVGATTDVGGFSPLAAIAFANSICHSAPKPNDVKLPGGGNGAGTVVVGADGVGLGAVGTCDGGPAKPAGSRGM